MRVPENAHNPRYVRGTAARRLTRESSCGLSTGWNPSPDPCRPPRALYMAPVSVLWRWFRGHERVSEVRVGGPVARRLKSPADPPPAPAPPHACEMDHN